MTRHESLAAAFNLALLLVCGPLTDPYEYPREVERLIGDLVIVSYVWIAFRVPFLRAESYSMIPQVGVGALVAVAIILPTHPSGTAYLVAVCVGFLAAVLIDWANRHDLG